MFSLPGEMSNFVPIQSPILISIHVSISKFELASIMQNFKTLTRVQVMHLFKLYLLLENQIARDKMEFWNKKKVSIFSNLGKFKNSETLPYYHYRLFQILSSKIVQINRHTTVSKLIAWYISDSNVDYKEVKCPPAVSVQDAELVVIGEPKKWYYTIQYLTTP